MSSEKKRSPSAKLSKTEGGEAPPPPPHPVPPAQPIPAATLQHQEEILETSDARRASPPTLDATETLAGTPTTVPTAPTASPPVLQGEAVLTNAPTPRNPFLLQRTPNLTTAAPMAPNLFGPPVLPGAQLLITAPTAPTAADPLRPQHLPLNDAAIIAEGNEEHQGPLPITPRPEGLAATTATALIAIAPEGPLGATGGAAAGMTRPPTGPELAATAATITAPPLNAFAAPNAFGPPVLVTRISLIEVGERFHEAKVCFAIQREAATEDVGHIVEVNRIREQLVRLAAIDLVSAWEAGFNNLLGAFFHRWGSEPIQRAGRNANGEKWDEYCSKPPDYTNVVFTVQRLGLLDSHLDIHRQGGYTFRLNLRVLKPS